jgi:hypothetical protein
MLLEGTGYALPFVMAASVLACLVYVFRRFGKNRKTLPC